MLRTRTSLNTHGNALPRVGTSFMRRSLSAPLRRSRRLLLKPLRVPLEGKVQAFVERHFRFVAKNPEGPSDVRTAADDRIVGGGFWFDLSGDTTPCKNPACHVGDLNRLL